MRGDGTNDNVLETHLEQLPATHDDDDDAGNAWSRRFKDIVAWKAYKTWAYTRARVRIGFVRIERGRDKHKSC